MGEKGRERGGASKREREEEKENSERKRETEKAGERERRREREISEREGERSVVFLCFQLPDSKILSAYIIYMHILIEGL